MYCSLYAVAQMPLAEAVLLLTIRSSLFVPFIAALWLRERVPPKLWIAIGTGFLGILFILRPDKICSHRSRLSDWLRECWPRSL